MFQITFFMGKIITMTTDLEFQGVPTISEEKQYWFIRTYSGETFRNYYANNYVGLGVNNVPQSLIKSSDFKGLYTFLDKNTSYKNGAATKMVRELISFEHEMKIGDTVIIPSRNSHELAIGTVESDVYLVENKGTFTFRGRPEPYPEKRRRIKWEKIVYRDDLNGDLRGLTSSHHGLTNANAYADTIEGTIDSLYIKNAHAYFTLKINQDEAINAFVLSRFLNGLTYFYQEWCIEKGYEVNEDLTIKIQLQSRGKVAIRALGIGAVIAIASMIVLSDNNEVKMDMGRVKVEGKSTGLLKSYSNFLDAKQERQIKWQEFQDSMQHLKAMRYDDSLKSEKEVSDNMQAKGKQ